MGKFLDWYSAHNTIIIQSLAVLIAILIVFFIFRLFFAKQNSDLEHHGQTGQISYDALDEKLNKLLEQHAQTKTVTVSQVEGGELTAQQIAEMDQLKTEIVGLKESLTKKESELLSAKEQAAVGSTSGDQLNDLNNKLTDYEKQIAKLNSRLSEYEIIAEDIADLQKYKSENDQLKKQVAEASQTKVEPQQEPQQTEPQAAKVESPVDAKEPESSASETASSNLQQDDIDKLLNNFSGDAPAQKEESQKASTDEVSADEIESLDDFEKNFQKG